MNVNLMYDPMLTMEKKKKHVLVSLCTQDEYRILSKPLDPGLNLDLLMSSDFMVIFQKITRCSQEYSEQSYSSLLQFHPGTLQTSLPK